MVGISTSVRLRILNCAWFASPGSDGANNVTQNFSNPLIILEGENIYLRSVNAQAGVNYMMLQGYLLPIIP
jgi:hypothetical protein